MKNSNLFLLILCLFLFSQSGLLLGSQRRRQGKERTDNREQGAVRRSQRRSRRRARLRRVDEEEQDVQRPEDQQRIVGEVVEAEATQGGTEIFRGFLSCLSGRKKKKRRRKRIKEGFHLLVSEKPPVQEDGGYTLTTLGEDENHKISIIKLSESDVYHLVYNKEKQSISVRSLSEDSEVRERVIEGVGSAKHYKIESGRYLFVETDYDEENETYTLTIFDLSKGFDEAVQTIENFSRRPNSHKIALGRYLCVVTQGNTLKIFDLSEGLGEPAQTIENVKGYKIVLGRYLCGVIQGNTLKIFDLSEGLGEPAQTIENVKSCEIVLGRYVFVRIRGYILKIFDLFKGSGELIQIIKNVKSQKIALGRFLCVVNRDYTLKIFDLSVDLERPIQTIKSITSFKIESEKYLCVKHNYLYPGGEFCDVEIRRRGIKLRIFDLSEGLDQCIREIRTLHHHVGLIGGSGSVDYKIESDRYLCIKEVSDNKRGKQVSLEVYDLSKGGTCIRIEKANFELDDCSIAGKYLFVKVRHVLHIFDLEVDSDRPTKTIEDIFSYNRPVQTIEDIFSYKIVLGKYLFVKIVDFLKLSYTLKIFDLSKNSEGLDKPIKTIENVRLRYSETNYKAGYRIIGKNLIVISGGSEEESQLQIFNLEQLGRAIQQDEEEEGETSNRVEQEYSTAPIFICVGAVGFKINDGLVSVEFFDGSIESNVFELDGGEVMAPSFPPEVEGPNFGDVQSVEYNLKDLQ